MERLHDDESDDGVYVDTGTNGGQPTVEGVRPGGGGVRSRSAAGGNKKDPMSGGPAAGHTIAGRTVDSSDASDTGDVDAVDRDARIGGAP